MEVQAMSEVVSVLREDGTADPRRDPGLEMEDVVELYRSMRRARIVSARLESLSESGEIGFLPSICLLYTSPSPRDQRGSRMPSSA